MNCTLKVLKLTLAFAVLSAVTAHGAMAQGKFTSASGGALTLTGTEIAGVNSYTFAFGIVIDCPGSTYRGHKIGTVSTFVPNGATSATITPKYVNCTDGSGEPVTPDPNCDFVFRDATTTGGVSGTYGIVTDIVCSGANTFAFTTQLCKAEFGAQTGLTGLHATNEGGDIRISGTTSLTATVCGFVGTTANWHLDITVKAHDEAGKAVNSSISD